MRALVIHPLVAGTGKDQDQVVALSHSLAADLEIATAPGMAEADAREAVDHDVLVAAGGDGTVHEVVNGLLNQHVEPRPRLAILPFGTGNDIARNLGILSIEDTLKALRDGTVRRFDVIRVALQGAAGPETVYGVLNCGIGFGAAVIRATTPLVKRLFGRQWCYTVGTFRAVVGWGSPALRIVHDGGVHEGRVFHLAVGNGEWECAGTMRLSPGARMDDGLLNVLLIHRGPKTEVIRNFAKIGTGEHIHHPLAEYFTTRRLEVTAEVPLEVQTDGDVIGRAPVTCEVVPGAVEVYAPPVEGQG